MLQIKSRHRVSRYRFLTHVDGMRPTQFPDPAHFQPPK